MAGHVNRITIASVTGCDGEVLIMSAEAALAALAKAGIDAAPLGATQQFEVRYLGFENGKGEITTRSSGYTELALRGTSLTRKAPAC